MIFVTLGTQDKHFPRLLEAVEKLEVDEEIIAQVGSTRFKSDKIKIFDYLDSEDFEKLSELLNVEFTPNKFVSNNMNFRKKLFEEINKEKDNESSKSIN